MLSHTPTVMKQLHQLVPSTDLSNPRHYPFYFLLSHQGEYRQMSKQEKAKNGIVQNKHNRRLLNAESAFSNQVRQRGAVL